MEFCCAEGICCFGIASNPGCDDMQFHSWTISKLFSSLWGGGGLGRCFQSICIKRGECELCSQRFGQESSPTLEEYTPARLGTLVCCHIKKSTPPPNNKTAADSECYFCCRFPQWVCVQFVLSWLVHFKLSHYTRRVEWEEDALFCFFWIASFDIVFNGGEIYHGK